METFCSRSQKVGSGYFRHTNMLVAETLLEIRQLSGQIGFPLLIERERLKRSHSSRVSAGKAKVRQ